MSQKGEKDEGGGMKDESNKNKSRGIWGSARSSLRCVSFAFARRCRVRWLRRCWVSNFFDPGLRLGHIFARRLVVGRTRSLSARSQALCKSSMKRSTGSNCSPKVKSSIQRDWATSWRKRTNSSQFWSRASETRNQDANNICLLIW